MSSLLVALARIDMTGCAGAPKVGMIPLPRRAFLQKKLPLGIKDPQMNRPVREVIHMHLATEAGLQNTVLTINHITHLFRMIMAQRGDMKSQVSPVIDRQILSPGRDGMSLGGGPLIPDSSGEFQK
jgi:hypothetical protein